MSTIPSDLQQWVAKDPDPPTAIVEPCCLHRRASDLAGYHPILPSIEPFEFRHTADPTGSFAIVKDISDNWNTDMSKVCSMLNLYPMKTIKTGVEFLIDREIGNKETPRMSGWKVTQWMVTKALDSSLTLRHQDTITWERGGDIVVTTFMWRVYRSMEA